MEIEGGGGGLWLPPEREFERFVAEFSRPERLEAELRRLLERFGVDPARWAAWWREREASDRK